MVKPQSLVERERELGGTSFRERKLCQTEREREREKWLPREVRDYCVIFVISLCFLLVFSLPRFSEILQQISRPFPIFALLSNSPL